MNLFTFRTIIKYVRREHKSNEVIKMISTESRDIFSRILRMEWRKCTIYYCMMKIHGIRNDANIVFLNNGSHLKNPDIKTPLVERNQWQPPTKTRLLSPLAAFWCQGYSKESHYLLNLNLQWKIFSPEKYNASLLFDDIVKMQVLTLKYAFHNPFLESCKGIQ